jgi:hypothetical protein
MYPSCFEFDYYVGRHAREKNKRRNPYWHIYVYRVWLIYGNIKSLVKMDEMPEQPGVVARYSHPCKEQEQREYR